MTATIEAEVTAVHAPGAEITQYVGTVVEEYRPRIVMAPEDAKALDAQLRACMLAVLREGVDYGTIPGATKPSLYKPGAEKLLQWFGFGHKLEATETEREDGRWAGVTYRCTVIKGMPDGRDVVVATCDGYAGYDEDRFFITAEANRAKAEANERKWARKDKREPIAAKWESAGEYRAPRNSVLKMAEKRAMVGAALQATSASSLFTQDMEDIVDGTARAVAGAASDAITELPNEVRGALGEWIAAQGWPRQSEWPAGRWCAVLIQAGKLSAGSPQDAAPAQGAAPQPPVSAGPKRAERSSATPDDDPFYSSPPPQDGTAEVAASLRVIPDMGMQACRTMWRKTRADISEGKLSDADGNKVFAALTARMEKLNASPGAQPAPQGAVLDLDPEDPWAIAITGLADDDTEGAIQLLDDLADQMRRTEIEPDRAAQVKAAVVARFPGIQNAPAAAA
jgi:hypothetical protein